jgi:hypothetical protein
MERGILDGLLKLGYELLSHVIKSKSKQLSEKSEENESLEDLEKKGEKERKFLSIFGMMSIDRSLRWNKSQGVYYELDELLELPPNQWSYNLQEWIGENASENNFAESEAFE